MISYFEDCKNMEELGAKRQALVIKSKNDETIKITEVNSEYSKVRKQLLSRKLEFKQILLYSTNDFKEVCELPIVSPFDLQIGKVDSNIIEIFSNNIVSI